MFVYMSESLLGHFDKKSAKDGRSKNFFNFLH